MENNIQKYMAFVKTVEYGSLSKAGLTLGYSQSAISRMISDLEKEWDVRLLERSKSGIQLTANGERLLPHIRALCGRFQTLQQEASAIQGTETGLIRIGTFSSVATHWLPNIIESFQKDNPKIEYELLLGDYTEIETWIDRGRVDLGFLRLPTRSHFQTIFLEKDELKVVLPPDHPLKDAAAFPLEALNDVPFMLLERDEKYEISTFLEENGLHPIIRLRTWDDYAVMSMVERGLGIAILPQLILRRHPYDLVIKSLEKPAWREIGLAMPSRQSLSGTLLSFLDHLSRRESTSE